MYYTRLGAHYCPRRVKKIVYNYFYNSLFLSEIANQDLKTRILKGHGMLLKHRKRCDPCIWMFAPALRLYKITNWMNVVSNGNYFQKMFLVAKPREDAIQKGVVPSNFLKVESSAMDVDSG